MIELLKFQDWAIDKGHYQTIASLKRYFKLLERRVNERTRLASKDNKETRERRPRCNQLDNCE